MTLAVMGACDAYMQKAMCVARGGHAVGIPQLRHSWTLIDKVFSQGGRPRGSLGADDEVWSVRPGAGAPGLARQDRDSRTHIISCTGRYSPVQSYTVPMDPAALSTGNVSAHAIPRHAHDMTRHVTALAARPGLAKQWRCPTSPTTDSCWVSLVPLVVIWCSLKQAPAAR